jgi:hypothetical protein
MEVKEEELNTKKKVGDFLNEKKTFSLPLTNEMGANDISHRVGGWTMGLLLEVVSGLSLVISLVRILFIANHK